MMRAILASRMVVFRLPQFAILLGLSLSVFDVGSAQTEGHQRRLSREEILAAIEWARTGKPAGYDLIWDVGRVSDPPNVVGKVYTPFVRVALWAHERGASENELATPRISAVPSDLVEPIIVVAVKKGPLCCPELRQGPPLELRAGLVAAGTLPTSLDDENERVLTRALWVTSDLAFLRRFDPAGAEDVVAIAAFPAEEMRAGRDVEVTQKRSDTSGRLMTMITIGSIRDVDLAAWK